MTTTKIRTYAQQKSGLTRAKNSGDPQKVIEECRRAKEEWNSEAWARAHNVRQGAWPDDWHRWNIACRDATSEAFGWHNAKELDEI